MNRTEKMRLEKRKLKIVNRLNKELQLLDRNIDYEYAVLFPDHKVVIGRESLTRCHLVSVIDKKALEGVL